MTSKRHFGSVRKLASGRWQARYRDGAGRRHSADRTFPTKRAAEHWLAMAEADLQRGDWADPALGRLTLAEWADEWMATTVHLRVKTRDGYASMLRTHVVPAFGQEPVANIEQVDVRRFLADLSAAGSAPGTVRAARKVLRLVLATALGSGAIRVNPCDGVRVPRSPRDEMVFLDHPQVLALADAMPPPYGTLVTFAAYTGLRAGEIGALRVGRLDLLRRRVEVVESVADVPGHGLVFGPTKTFERRSVPLPQFLVDEMAAYLVGRPTDPEDFVFTAPEGGPLRHRNFYRRHFKPAVHRAGLPERTRFHDLRHTCAAILVAEGAHSLAVMKRLGHSSITVTMNTYGHLFPALEEALTDGLDRAYRAAQERSSGARVGHDSESATGTLPPITAVTSQFVGGDDGTRTHDPLLAKQVL